MRNAGLRPFLAQSRDATRRSVTQFDVALCNIMDDDGAALRHRGGDKNRTGAMFSMPRFNVALRNIVMHMYRWTALIFGTVTRSNATFGYSIDVALRNMAMH